jgi:hypothetical protein
MAENTELTALAELQAQLAASLEENAAAKEIIALQNKQIEELDASQGADTLTVVINKEKHQIVTPSFMLDGVQYTANDVLKDKALAAKLVDLGSGVLVKVKPSK